MTIPESQRNKDIIFKYGSDPEVWTYVSWSILIIVFGCIIGYVVHMFQDRNVLVVIKSYSFKVLPCVVGVLAMGNISYVCMDHAVLPDFRNSVETLSGRDQATAYGMTALTFLLVFRTSQSMAHWWEGRGHIGKLILDLKFVVFIACAEQSPDRQHSRSVAALAKLLFDCVRVQLHEHQLESLEAAFKRILPSDSFSDWRKKLEIDNTREELWTKSAAGGRVMLTWKWLSDKALGQVGRGPASPFFGPLGGLLEAIHGAGKIKMFGKEKGLVHILEGPIFYLTMVYFVPVQLALQYHKGMSQVELEVMKTRHVFRADFCLALLTVSSFFTFLRNVANNQADPYKEGDHFSVDLQSFQKGLIHDLDLFLADADAKEKIQGTDCSTQI